MIDDTPTSRQRQPPIVPSAHLSSPDSWPLSEFDYGMITVHNTFSRRIIRCMHAG